MTYPPSKVVAGFAREVSEEERIPFTLARTSIEQEHLRRLLKQYLDFFSGKSHILEFGCGYGRLLPIPREFSRFIYGVERDSKLAGLAKELNPEIMIFNSDLRNVPIDANTINLAFTFTVLQHMPDVECQHVLQEMMRTLAVDGTLILCEEENSGDGTWGRAVTTYLQWLPGFKLFHTEPRIGELGIVHGNYMVFRR